MEVSNVVVGVVAAVVLAIIVAAGFIGYYFYKLTSTTNVVTGEASAHFELKNNSILLEDGESTERVVSDSTADVPVTIFFGHPGCFHSAESVLSFEEAAGDAAGKTVFVADADMVGDSVIQSFNVEAFPTVIRFSAPNERVVYSGDRSVTSFASFIEGGA
tara:strand:+ start:282 stop:761 length:480 start_codon:yes stop_codon:yes gene_type:complete